MVSRRDFNTNRHDLAQETPEAPRAGSHNPQKYWLNLPLNNVKIRLCLPVLLLLLMAEKLGLAEIAAKYNKTPKTFSKYVKKLGIPHEALGRFMYFNEGKVEAYLESLRAQPTVINFRLPVKQKRLKVVGTVKSKFAEAV